MKTLILALVTLCSVNAFAARTLEQEVARTKQKFSQREAKKQRKALVKAKYASQIEKIKNAQQAEMDNL